MTRKDKFECVGARLVVAGEHLLRDLYAAVEHAELDLAVWVLEKHLAGVSFWGRLWFYWHGLEAIESLRAVRAAMRRARKVLDGVAGRT